jgi:murein endopeptidase
VTDALIVLAIVAAGSAGFIAVGVPWWAAVPAAVGSFVAGCLIVVVLAAAR